LGILSLAVALFFPIASLRAQAGAGRTLPSSLGAGGNDATSGPAEILSQPLVTGPAKAAAYAPVSIIEFSDFECPFCGQVAPFVQELLRAYPKQVRFIFKHNPLPMHTHAALAHEAALAAAEQGKFWEMHDLLFANQKNLEMQSLLEYAKQLNIDVATFQKALESHRYRPQVEQDVAEAKGLGVTATPTFFVNGRKAVGAQSLDSLKGLVDQALGISTGPALARKEIAVGEAPVRGAARAPITIVEFADFQCPFCGRALPTLQQLLRDYPDRVRWVFKNFPLDFHQDSFLAHQAALAAGAQGKFWELHDRIFVDQPAIKRDDLIQAAKGLGLDVTRFVTDLDSGRFRASVEADRAEGNRLGVSGTPTFFINGKELVGAASLAEFKRMVDGELQATGVKSVTEAKKVEARISDAGATRGPAGAPATIVWYSDLESPLSLKAAQVMQQVMEAYPGAVRLVFKNRPLEFHAEAKLAHEAALAAGAQGKFWEMHDLVLANQRALSKEDLTRYAGQLGLDRETFAAALAQGTYREAVDQDLAEAGRLGVLGVPAFFINGQRVDGVQPLSVFKGIIETQLQRVQIATGH
jgi:protein-disulfide isomerase